MADPLTHTLSYEEAAPILARPKVIVGDVVWANAPANGVFYSASFNVLDDNEVGIPGLTFDLYYRRGLLRAECLFKFTLFQLTGTNKRRVSQLEVVPPYRRKHTENHKPLYGPHLHLGTRAQSASSGELGCEHHPQWFTQFLSLTNIAHRGSYSDPDPPSLQPDLFDPER